MSIQATILLITLATLATAAALGVTLGVQIFRRAVRRFALPEGRLVDLAQTEQGYLLASALSSLAAFAAFRIDGVVFGVLLTVAASFLMAEHVILPRMREAAEAGGDAGRDVRGTFEAIQSLTLLLAFFLLTLPPLATLARVWGI
jgi:hypothetical protein